MKPGESPERVCWGVGCRGGPGPGPEKAPPLASRREAGAAGGPGAEPPGRLLRTAHPPPAGFREGAGWGNGPGSGPYDGVITSPQAPRRAPATSVAVTGAVPDEARRAARPWR